MPRVTTPLVLSQDHQQQLERWLAALGTPQQVALRCQIILGIAAGKAEIVVAAENGVNRKTVRLWRERFLTQGLQGLWEIAPGWFAELTNKRIRRDSFHSVDDLIAAIEQFLAVWNQKPKPFVWTATVESILAKLTRCRQTLEQIQPGCTAPKSRKRKSS